MEQSIATASAVFTVRQASGHKQQSTGMAPNSPAHDRPSAPGPPAVGIGKDMDGKDLVNNQPNGHGGFKRPWWIVTAKPTATTEKGRGILAAIPFRVGSFGNCESQIEEE